MSRLIAFFLSLAISIAFFFYAYKMGEVRGSEFAKSGFERGYNSGFATGKIFGSSTAEVEVCEHSVLIGVKFLTPVHIVCQPKSIIYDCNITVPLKEDGIVVGDFSLNGKFSIIGSIGIDDGPWQILISHCHFESLYQPDESELWQSKIPYRD